MDCEEEEWDEVVAGGGEGGVDVGEAVFLVVVEENVEGERSAEGCTFAVFCKVVSELAATRAEVRMI